MKTLTPELNQFSKNAILLIIFLLFFFQLFLECVTSKSSFKTSKMTKMNLIMSKK